MAFLRIAAAPIGETERSQGMRATQKTVLWSIGALGVAAALTSCSSERVEAPPAYTAETLPIVVALKPHDDKVARAIAPGLATEFERIALFKKVIQPYQTGDAVDCVFDFEATAMAEGATDVTFFSGPAVKFIHNVSFDLTNGVRSVGRDSVHVESEAEYGAFANVNDVASKQSALQLRKIAIAVAEKLNLKRSEITDICKGYTGA